MSPGTPSSEICPFLPPTEKGEDEPDETIVALIQATNKCLLDKGHPQEPGQRQDQCHFASSAICFFAEKLGLEANQFEINTLQSRFREAPNAQTFIHTFAVVKVNNTTYLIDTTFGQFFLPDKTIGQSGQSNGISIDNPLAQKLFANGYVKLTPEILGEYLRITAFVDKPSPPIGINQLTSEFAKLPYFTTQHEAEENYNLYLPVLSKIQN